MTESDPTMSIVPIYRLRAPDAKDPRRYRFSSEALPNPNARPGSGKVGVEHRWLPQAVAFYAWKERADDGLVPVYEFVNDENGTVRYQYSTTPEAPAGWLVRPYVVFWVRPTADKDTVPVYRFRQEGVSAENVAFSTDEAIKGWKNEEVAFYASNRAVVRIGIRENRQEKDGFSWSFAPTALNLAHETFIEFVPEAGSDFVFADFEIDEKAFKVERFDRKVMVRTLFTPSGQDFKYRVKATVGPRGVVSERDPEVIYQTPTDL